MARTSASRSWRPTHAQSFAGAMHIKGVAIEGFKCYKDKVYPDAFSPQHNVIGKPPPIERREPRRWPIAMRSAAAHLRGRAR